MNRDLSKFEPPKAELDKLTKKLFGLSVPPSGDKRMNEQCKFCIHNSVCAYREHYEDAVKLYEKARAECGKYPWFKCKIECVQYRKEDNQHIKRSIENGSIENKNDGECQ